RPIRVNGHTIQPLRERPARSERLLRNVTAPSIFASPRLHLMENRMDMFALDVRKPAPLPTQGASAADPPALPTVLERDELRISEWMSVSSIFRSTSRSRAP